MEPSIQLIGPFGVRPIPLEKACDVHVGHEHNYDHDTVVIRGPLQVSFSDAAGRVVETSQVYEAGAVIFIAARRKHVIKALADDTFYLCIFSHRDFDGRVSQEYVGNTEAYSHDRAIAPQTVMVRTPLTAKRVDGCS